MTEEATSHDGMDVDQVTYRHSVGGVHTALVSTPFAAAAEYAATRGPFLSGVPRVWQ